MSSSNKFQWLTIGGQNATKPTYDIILSETDKFVVLPSLGSLVPNWILIVPKQPMPCLSHLNQQDRDDLLKLSEAIRLKFGWPSESTFLFEHGGAYGSKINCGVDQAHLHMIELDFDLPSAAKQFDGGQLWETHEGHLPIPDMKISTAKEYLACSNSGKVHLLKPIAPVSQFFRKVIAKETKQFDKWDYKSFPLLDEVQETFRKFVC